MNDHPRDLRPARPQAIAQALPGAARRDFLRNVLLYTGAGLAAGSLAALGKERWEAGQAALLTADDLRGQLDNSAREVALLRESLQAAQVALDELRPQLSAAITENANLQNTLLEKQQEADGLRRQLSDAQFRIGNFERLVSLYDDLEQTGLDTTVVNGLANAAVGFGAAIGIAPLAAEGLALARSLFDTLEDQFPVFRSGLNWLDERLASLSTGMDAVETAVGQAVRTLNPAASKLGQLIDYILGHLPFGIGQNIRAALISLNDLYHSLPDLIVGANSQVVNTLNSAFSEGATGIAQTVLRPIRENAFAPAEQLTSHFNSLYETYVRDLHDPVVGVVDRRNAIRKEIEAFRAANQI